MSGQRPLDVRWMVRAPEVREAVHLAWRATRRSDGSSGAEGFCGRRPVAPSGAAAGVCRARLQPPTADRRGCAHGRGRSLRRHRRARPRVAARRARCGATVDRDTRRPASSRSSTTTAPPTTSSSSRAGDGRHRSAARGGGLTEQQRRLQRRPARPVECPRGTSIAVDLGDGNDRFGADRDAGPDQRRGRRRQRRHRHRRRPRRARRRRRRRHPATATPASTTTSARPATTRSTPATATPSGSPAAPARTTARQRLHRHHRRVRARGRRRRDGFSSAVDCNDATPRTSTPARPRSSTTASTRTATAATTRTSTATATASRSRSTATTPTRRSTRARSRSAATRSTRTATGARRRSRSSAPSSRTSGWSTAARAAGALVVRQRAEGRADRAELQGPRLPVAKTTAPHGLARSRSGRRCTARSAARSLRVRDAADADASPRRRRSGAPTPTCVKRGELPDRDDRVPRARRSRGAGRAEAAARRCCAALLLAPGARASATARSRSSGLDDRLHGRRRASTRSPASTPATTIRFTRFGGASLGGGAALHAVSPDGQSVDCPKAGVTVGRCSTSATATTSPRSAASVTLPVIFDGGAGNDGLFGGGGLDIFNGGSGRRQHRLPRRARRAGRLRRRQRHRDQRRRRHAELVRGDRGRRRRRRRAPPRRLQRHQPGDPPRRRRHPRQRHRPGLLRRRRDQPRPRRRRLAAPAGLQRRRPRRSSPGAREMRRQRRRRELRHARSRRSRRCRARRQPAGRRPARARVNLKLTAKNFPKGATIELRCTGRGLPVEEGQRTRRGAGRP